jgi:hypothetical protein
MGSALLRMEAAQVPLANAQHLPIRYVAFKVSTQRTMELLASQRTETEPARPAQPPQADAPQVPPAPAEGAAAQPAPGNPVMRYLTVAVGAAVIGGSTAGGVLFLAGRPAPAPAAVRAPALQPVVKPGSLSVATPEWLPAGYLRVSVLRSGRTAVAADGSSLADLPAEALGGKALPAGNYLVRFNYRDTAADETTVEVRSGVSAELPVDQPAMARIEYQLGVKADAAKAGDGITYFRRAVKLDNRQVAAHLQLAAYELLGGRPAAVREHLKAVRAVDAGNADAAAIEKLLPASPKP